MARTDGKVQSFPERLSLWRNGGSRCVCQDGSGHCRLSRITVICVQRTDESDKTGEELGMKIAAFPQFEISLKLKTCLAIEAYI